MDSCKFHFVFSGRWLSACVPFHSEVTCYCGFTVRSCVQLWPFFTAIIIVPRALAKAGDIKSHSSVCPSLCLSVPLSVCHKNFKLAHIFWSINDRALISGMHDLCDKPFQMPPCHGLDLDIGPFSKSNLLLCGGPQFSEFACLVEIQLLIF